MIVTAGAVCLTAGAFLISLIDSDSGYGAVVPGMVVLGIGVGLFYASITTAAVTALDPSRSSLAGGLVYMFRWRRSGSADHAPARTACRRTSREAGSTRAR